MEQVRVCRGREVRGAEGVLGLGVTEGLAVEGVGVQTEHGELLASQERVFVRVGRVEIDHVVQTQTQLFSHISNIDTLEKQGS